MMEKQLEWKMENELETGFLGVYRECNAEAQAITNIMLRSMSI